MAKFSSVNGLPATGAVAMYTFKTQAVAAGWTIPSSSDGTTYNSSGDQISSGAAGANGFANTNAWFIMRDPAGLREYCVQRTTNNTVYRIKYSASAQFSGGSPGATRVPSATDEQTLRGSGTDASPTGASVFTTDNTYRYHVIFQSTAHDGVYGFWSWSTVNATGVVGGIQICEPLDVNSSSTLDTDPVCWIVGQTTITVGIIHPGGSFGFAWYKIGLGGAAFVTMGVYSYVNPSTAAAGAPNGFGTNAYDTNDNGLPVLWGRDSGLGSSTGIKGFGKYMRLKAGGRNYPDTINLTSDSYVYVNDFLIPWEDNTVPVV